jgi:hypothetical protein
MRLIVVNDASVALGGATKVALQWVYALPDYCLNAPPDQSRNSVRLKSGHRNVNSPAELEGRSH